MLALNSAASSWQPAMEEVLMQSQMTGSVVLDVESLTQISDKCCSGSPKMTRALSRKGSCRLERRGSDEQEVDETSKKLVIKVVPSQMEHLKQPLAAVPPVANSLMLADSGDGRNKKANRLTATHPRKILLFFATMSSMGTMILIYFTLAINRRGGS